MKTEILPILPKQLIAITLLIALPMLAAAAGILIFPRSRAVSPSDLRLTAALLLAMLALAGGMLASMTRRRSICLDGEALTVKCSFYTARLTRADLKALTIEPIERSQDLPLCIKTNGVAAFGYYAGWFSGSRGERCFCAVGALPAYVFRFAADAPVPLLVVSCSAAMSTAIDNWVNGAPSWRA